VATDLDRPPYSRRIAGEVHTCAALPMLAVCSIRRRFSPAVPPISESSRWQEENLAADHVYFRADLRLQVKLLRLQVLCPRLHERSNPAIFEGQL
jgi:hypothetical protein